MSESRRVTEEDLERLRRDLNDLAERAHIGRSGWAALVAQRLLDRLRKLHA